MLKVAVLHLLFLTCLLLLRRQANLSLIRFRYNVLLNARQCIILSFTCFSCFPFLSQSRCFGEIILFSNLISIAYFSISDAVKHGLLVG